MDQVAVTVNREILATLAGLAEDRLDRARDDFYDRPTVLDAEALGASALAYAWCREALDEMDRHKLTTSLSGYAAKGNGASASKEGVCTAATKCTEAS